MKNKLLLTSGLLSILVLTQSISITTFAAPGNDLGLKVCDEKIFPFKIGGVFPPDDDANNIANYSTSLSQSECQANAPYPNAHKAIPDNEANQYNVPQKAITDNIHAPFAQHEHTFIENSVEDANYIYKAFVGKFEITLESDATSNTLVENDQLRCPIIAGQTGTVKDDFEHCGDLSGTTLNEAYDPDHWGGVKLTKKTVGSSIVITWEYGANGTGGRPILPGDSPTIDIRQNDPNIRILDFDTSNSNLDSRSWTEYVRLTSDNNAPAKIWTGTTTSRALIHHQRILKAPLDTLQERWNYGCADNGWCYIDPSTYVPNAATEDLSSNGTSRKYHWSNIGTVATVWKDLTPPPSCLGLNITSPAGAANGSVTLDGTPVNFNLVVAPQPSNVPIQYRWKTNNNTGAFNGNPSSNIGFVTNSTSVTYQNSNPVNGTIVTVQGLDPNNTAYAPICSDSFTLNVPPKQSQVCDAFTPIIRTDVTPVTNTTVGFKLNTTASFSSLNPGATPLQIKYRWRATQSGIIPLPGGGQAPITFQVGKFSATQNGSLLNGEITTTNPEAFFYYDGNPKDIKINVTAVEFNDTTKVINPLNQCFKDLILPDIPDTVCESLDNLVLTQNGVVVTEDQLKENTSIGIVTSPNFSPANESIPLNYNWKASRFEPEASCAQDPDACAVNEVFHGQFIDGPVPQPFTPGNPVTDNDPEVVYTGGPAGTIISVTAVAGGVEQTQCHKEIRIPQPPELPACDSLTIYQGDNPIAEQIEFADPVDQLSLRVVKDPELNLTYRWQSRGINTNNLTGVFNQLNNLSPESNPFSTTNTQDFVTLKNLVKTEPIVVSAMGYLPRDPIAKCADRFIIKPPVETPACDSLTILRNGTPIDTVINHEDPLNNLTLNVVKDPELDLVYQWSASPQGQFAQANTPSANPNPGNPLVTDNTTNPVTLSQTSTTQDTAVYVIAFNPRDRLKTVKCSDRFVMRPPEQNFVCRSLQITRNGQDIGSSITTVDPLTGLALNVDKDAQLDLKYSWSASPQGQFTQATNPPIGPANPLDTSDPNSLMTLAGVSTTQTTNVLVEGYTEVCRGEILRLPPTVNNEGRFIPGLTLDLVRPQDEINPTTSTRLPLDIRATEATPNARFDWVKALNIPTLRIQTTNAQTPGCRKVVQCSDRFVMNPPPTERPVCDDSQYTLISSNGNPLDKNESSLLTASGKNTDGTIISTMNWSTTAGTLQIAPTGGVCSTLAVTPEFTPGLTLNNVPASCSVLFSGAAAGTTVNVTAVPVESGNICKRQITVIEPPQNPPPYCLDLVLTPTSLNLGSSNTYNAKVLYSNGQNYETTVEWNATQNGSFTDGTTQTKNSQFNFTNTFSSSSETESSFNIKAIDAPNNPEIVDFSQCTYAVSQYKPPVRPPEEECEDLNLRPPKGNEYCVDLEGEVDGEDLLWTIDGDGTFDDNGKKTITTTINSNRECVDINDFDSDSSLSVRVIGQNQCRDQMEGECDHLELIPPNEDNEVCLDTDYDGPFEWIINGDSDVNNKKCQEIENGDEVEVYVSEQCRDKFKFNERPPRLEKAVSKDGTKFARIISVARDSGNVDYRLTFKIYENEGVSAVIKDTISSGGIIEGIFSPGNGQGGEVSYVNGSMKVHRQSATGPLLQECDNNDDEEDYKNCYTGEIDEPGGVHLYRVNDDIVITYEGRVESDLTDARCKEGTYCQETYNNRAEAEEMTYMPPNSDEDKPFDEDNTQSNESSVQIFCQYILSRASGDIFLENDLNTGVDIEKCSKYRSTTGIVITPTPEGPTKIPSTGAPGEQTIFTIDHEICASGQAGTLNTSATGDSALGDFYGQGVSQNLSSSICEVKTNTANAWKKETIVQGIEENKTRLSRWGGSNQELNVNTIDPTDSTSVYHVVNNNIVVNNDYTLNDGDGAKTFIVENGDLIIKGNIKYGACTKAGGCSARDTASLAFIVLNGNIYVDPSVETMSGVYFVQKGENADSGKLISGSVRGSEEVSPNALTVFGSIYGDIEPLFQKRTTAGSPGLEEASIKIRFDQRILLNTPPGLRDVVTVDQSEGA